MKGVGLASTLPGFFLPCSESNGRPSKAAFEKVSREQRAAKREEHRGAEGEYGGAEGEHKGSIRQGTYLIDEISSSEGAKRRPFSQLAVTCYVTLGSGMLYLVWIRR